MNTDDPISKALALTSGADFHRCALQVNPHDYSGTFRGQDSPIDPESHAKAIVEKAAKMGVSVLAGDLARVRRPEGDSCLASSVVGVRRSADRRSSGRRFQ